MDIQFGLYDRVMDSELVEAVSELDRALVAVETQQLDPGDSHTFLARHLYALLLRRLRAFTGDGQLEQQVALCNQIVDLLDETGTADGHLPGADEVRRLLAVLQRSIPGAPVDVTRPDTPLSTGCLLTGAQRDPAPIACEAASIAPRSHVERRLQLGP